MSTEQAKPSKQQILDLLMEDPSVLPELLADRPELLDGLSPKKLNGDDGVVDFQQHRIDSLQKELSRHEDFREELVDTSRSNLASQHQIHDAVLHMLAASDLQALVTYISQDMAQGLHIDAAILCVESKESRGPFIREPILNTPSGKLTGIFPAGTSVILGEPTELTAGFFGPAASLIQSLALIQMAIGENRTPAMLALGDRDPDRFHKGQATHLLRFFGDALAARLGHFLTRSSSEQPPQWSTPE